MRKQLFFLPEKTILDTRTWKKRNSLKALLNIADAVLSVSLR